MAKYLNFLLVCLLLFSSCDNEENVQEVQQELTSIDQITHAEAAEIIRHNILAGYGGVFKLMQYYHEEVRVVGMDCDTSVQILMMDSHPEKYTLSSNVQVQTSCGDAWNVYNNRFFRASHQLGNQVTSSDVFDLEMRIADMQTIAGNFEDDVYTYGHTVDRDILITRGMSAELDPVADLFMIFPGCTYDEENVLLTGLSKGSFELDVRTNEGDPIPFSEKSFSGSLEMLDGIWTLLFDDGMSIPL